MELTNSEKSIETANSTSHEAYMRRAIELAHNGSGYVSPNPLVGCVVVHNDLIVGEGWHKRYGGPHAEVNAIEDVQDKSILSSCRLYVNLEPCSHTGKTPPCADMLIRLGVGQVLIANQDPNPLVSGNGIGKLRDAGVSVVGNILAEEGRELNRRFFTYMQKKRPHIILKWAETSDGFIARENYDSKWISDEYSRQLVHKWRSEEDAVLVASGTAWHDNPLLNVRSWTGRDPLRVVVDRHLKLGANQHLFDGKQKTICYNLLRDDSRENLMLVKLDEHNMLESIVKHLYSENIQSVIVEGGGQMLRSFIQAGLWDEARIFVSPKAFRAGIPAPVIKGRLIKHTQLVNDWLKIVVPLGDTDAN